MRYDGTTGAFLDAFVPSGYGNLALPHGLLIGADGNLLVASPDGDHVGRFDSMTGEFLGDFIPSGSGGVNRPVDIIFGLDGNLLVSSANSYSIKRYDATTGAYLGDFVPPNSGGLQRPHGMVIGPDNNLYVMSAVDDSVMRFDGTTGAPLPAPGKSGAIFVDPGTLLDAWGELAFGPDGNLYVSNYGGSDVLRIDAATGNSLGEFVPAGDHGLINAHGLAFGPDGNLYVVSQGNNSVYRYNGLTGAFIDVFVPPVHLDGPTYLTFWDTGGNSPAVFDLARDWSDTSNPNGVWQYRHGDTAITNHWATGWNPFEGFASAQPAWADTASTFGFIPAWFQSVTTSPDPTYDVPIGRVATHTTDPTNGDDSAWSNVLWTSPLDGVATISGDTWQAKKSLGRSNDWGLFHDGAILTGGIVTSTDPFNSSNPFLFQNGSGGPDVLTFPVAVGDTIMFEAVRAFSIAGDYVGVDLTITVTPGSSPSPGTPQYPQGRWQPLHQRPEPQYQRLQQHDGGVLGMLLPPESGALYRPTGLVTDPVVVSPSARQAGGNPYDGTYSSRPSASLAFTRDTLAPAAWGSASGSVALAMPQVRISPALARAVKDGLFEAWATENSALEPLPWIDNAEGNLVDGKR
jgi:hypothetical protein